MSILKKYTTIFYDKRDLLKTIKAGIPSEDFDKIRVLTKLSTTDWVLILNISSRTLERKRKVKKEKFDSVISEKILMTLEVFNKGVSVFEDEDKYLIWLKDPSPIFDGKAPIDFLSTAYGKELVMDELNRIEYGVFC